VRDRGSVLPLGAKCLYSARTSIAILLFGAATLYLGVGQQITVLPIRAELEGFGEFWIGIMGAAYFAGFALGCLIGPFAVKQVGHIRCFAGFAALAAIAVLAFPLAVAPAAWTALRGFAGLCLAVLYMVVESWLNEQADNKIRGKVLSIYIVIANVVTIGGQQMVNVFDVRATAQFVVIAMLICLSLVPMSLAPTKAPKPIASAKLRLGALFRLSKSGVIGCATIGLVEGTFWTFGPIFAQGQGLSVSQITLFMSMFLIGGTLSQWPLGHLSDRVDRRYVVVVCCVGTVSTSLVLALVPLAGITLNSAVAGLHGAFMIPLYALLLAHTNDYAPTEALVEVSSGLLLVYAVGAAVGPLAVGPVIQEVGRGGLFLVIAAVLSAFTLFVLVRLLIRGRAGAETRVEFVPVPKTTQSVYAEGLTLPSGSEHAFAGKATLRPGNRA